MKKFFILLFCMCVFAQACTEADSREFQNTIKVEPEDTESVIIEKAAHVIPSPYQLQALKDEFIAFVHFGPNTFTQMEWEIGRAHV